MNSRIHPCAIPVLTVQPRKELPGHEPGSPPDMKTCLSPSIGKPLAGLFRGLLLTAAVLSGAASSPGAGSAPARANSVTAAPARGEIPLSVFVIPSSPSEGRNPFFPQSTAPKPVVKSNTAPRAADPSSFVLNGITSPPKRSAMINSHTFEVGEQGEVRLPNGAKAIIKCLAISNSSAVILYEGHRHELHLRSGI